MKIIVFIKQVPDTTQVKINPQTHTIIREGVPSIINPFDLYAIEEGLRLKEKFGGRVRVVSMGPPQAEQAIRQAIALGVDEGFLLTDVAFAGADTLATSYTLSLAAKKLGDFDLLICGKQASDGDTAQVGPGIAQHLEIPFVAFVKKIEEISLAEGKIKVAKMTDEGHQIIEMKLPALITVVKEINEPRTESLTGKLRAKSANIIRWGHQDLEVVPEKVGLDGSPTQVVNIFAPPPRPQGEIFEGEPQILVEKLLDKIKDII